MHLALGQNSGIGGQSIAISGVIGHWGLQVISLTRFILAAGESVMNPSPIFPLAQLYFLMERLTSARRKSQKLCACISVSFWSSVKQRLQSSQFFSQQYWRRSWRLSTAKSGQDRMSARRGWSSTQRSGYLMAMYLELRVEIMEQARRVSLRVSVAHRMVPSPTVLIRKVTLKQLPSAGGSRTRYSNNCSQYSSRFCELIWTSRHTLPSPAKSTSFWIASYPSATTYIQQGVSPSLASASPGPRVRSSALLASLLNSSKESLAKKGIFWSLARMYSFSALSTAWRARLTQILCTLRSLTRLMALSSVSPSSKLNTRRSLMARSMNCCSSIEQICFWILHLPSMMTMEQESRTCLRLGVMSAPGSYQTYSSGGTFVSGQ